MMAWSYYYGSHCKYCNEPTLCNDYDTDNEGNHLNCKEKSNTENHAIENHSGAQKEGTTSNINN